MKEHKIFKMGPDKKLQSYKIFSRTRSNRYFAYVIVSALVLLIYICIPKNANLKTQVTTRTVAAAKYEKSRKILNLIRKNKSFLQNLRIAKETNRPFKQHMPTGAAIDGPQHHYKQNKNVFLKAFYKTGNSMTVLATAYHKEKDIFKEPNVKRFKRVVNFKNKTNETVQQQKEISVKAAVNFTNPAAAFKCQEFQTNCTLYCLDGSVSYLDDNIGNFKPKCPNNDFSLILANCEFNLGILQQSFFHSASKITHLSISECNLQVIKETAFQHPNAQTLQTLNLINNQLRTLKDNAFEGLVNLGELKFVQNTLKTIFKADRFFKPFASNLKAAVIQPNTNGTEVNDPLNWWQDLKMNSLLKLDLSNTNLRGVLNSSTFQPFEKLGILILFNCNLLNIKADIWNIKTNSLNYLDLQYNHLKTLDSAMLQKINIPTLEINLNLNDWWCECNGDMLQYLAGHDVQLTLSEELVCSGPEKWQQMELKQVIEECQQVDTTKATTMTSSSVTSAEVSSTKYSTTTATSVQAFTGLKTSTTPLTTIHQDFQPSQDLMTMKCFSADNQTETFYTDNLNSKVKFSINIKSTSSAMVKVEAPKVLPHFLIIYFTNHTSYNYISDIKEINYIEYLKPLTAYVFCLSIEPTLFVSPFDCQAAYTFVEQQPKIWLLQSDKAWLISMISIVAILLFAVSILSAYKCLRHKPHWLFIGKQNPSKIINLPQNVLVVARNASMKYRSPPHTSGFPKQSAQYSSSLASLQAACNIADETFTVYNSQHTVPLTRAPPAIQLGNTSSSVATKCTNSSRCCSQLNADYLKVIQNDPDYQTIDYYEEVNV